MWAAVADATRLVPRPRRAPDRAPERPAAYRVRRWALSAALALAATVALWLWSRPAAPNLLAEAGPAPTVYTAPDGSRFTLRPHSRLYALGPDRYGLEGEAHVAVTPDPTRTVQVEARGATVTVLGTAFNVRTWGNEVEVFLEEGRVRLEAGGDAVELAPGQRAAVAPDGRLHRPETLPPGPPPAWREGVARFAQTPLPRAVAELEHHHAVRVLLPAAWHAETVSGEVRLDDPARSLGDLAAVLGGRLERLDERTFRLLP